MNQLKTKLSNKKKWFITYEQIKTLWFPIESFKISYPIKRITKECKKIF